MKLRFSAFLFFLAFAVNSFLAQAQDYTKLNQFLDSLEIHDKFMGTVLLASDGKPVFERALGYADRERKIKATVATHYRIGSISKMFTTVLVLKAEESGKLSLDQKLADFYPQIKNSDKITLSMLLQHRSGIHNFTNNPDYLSYHTKPVSEEALVKIISDGGSDFEPDSKADYSNSNFVLLTFILEKVYEKSFSEILDEQLVKPLKLESTAIFTASDPGKGESFSYTFKDKWILEAETDPSIPLGAGAISSDVKDLNTFINALFSGKLISEESLEKMKEINQGFGRGMFSFPYYERKGFGHTGGIDGFRSFLGYFPEEKLTVAVLSNGLNYNNNDILLALMDSYFGKDFEVPSFQPVVLSAVELEKYLGEYASDQIPLRLVFEQNGSKLIAKPSGQQATELEATAVHTFEFKPVNAVFVFNPEKGEVTLKQAGQTFLFKKQ
ncbi:serine hydrolase domain-containing protein [Algoriphagus boritolerans]|uniref:Beta-lactamase n=2 Tax=Algoriphagus TaxID=246875 RepID=A0A1H6AC19_9BACT|nr:serine hydrolase domain-containing protein [Algoriphagus boritolerans]SEG46021.1 Beta-lactamase [Algoriphagus boritolerans DSM 17298 = JCM 18970]